MLTRKLPPIQPEAEAPIPIESVTARKSAPSAAKRTMLVGKEKVGKKSPDRESDRPAYWFF